MSILAAMLGEMKTTASTLSAQSRLIVASVLLASAAILLPARVAAQDTSAQNQPVTNPQPDINGVDIANAQYSIVSPFGFNAPGAGHLQVRAAFNGRRFTTNLETFLTDDTVTDPDSGDPNSRQIRVHVSGMDQMFVCATIGPCRQVGKVDGTRFTRTADKSYSWQGRDGTLVSFFPMYVEPIAVCMGGGDSCNGANYGGFAYASSIVYSNGEKLTFASNPTVSGSTMVSTITSNLGYTVDAIYPCTSCSSNASPPGSAWVLYGGLANASSYVLKENGIELDRLSFDRVHTNFPGSQAGQLAAQDDWKATDKIGRVFKVRLQAKKIAACMPGSDGWGVHTAYDESTLNPVRVITPGGVETDITYKDVAAFSASHIVPVSSVTKGGHTWLYSFVDTNDGGGTLTATDPLGNSQSRVAVTYPVPWVTGWGQIPTTCFVSITGSDVVQSNDEVGRQTTFTYVGQGTVASATLPADNGYGYIYDSRGNATSVTFASPAGSATSLVVFQASYDANCGNPVTCNKPNWTRDANGAQTDYQYDPVHGGPTVVARPADQNGVRPQTRYTYEGYDTGNGILYRVATISECRSQTACSGNAGEVTHSFTYWGSTFLVSSDTVQAGDGGIALTSSYAYDSAGHLVQETKPSGASSWRFYDAVGRQVGLVGPDPDGAGPLPRPAQRTSYNNDDQMTRMEEGSAASADAAGLAAMSVAKATDISYNPDGQKTVERVYGADGAEMLTHYSYDAVGRLECTATRMDPAQWMSQADACAPQLNGSNGPDRITRNIYDAAGQLVQVRKAVGTPLEQAYATYSYTPNGKQQYIIDANGNRAQMVYDGFDRQVQWFFPSATRPSAYNPGLQSNDGATVLATALTTAGSVNANDYEQYGYDANGNRTSLRKRDGSVLNYTFDALNRMTLKTVPGRGDLPGSATRSVYYGYDLQGHQTYARFDSSTGEGVTNSWDGFGRQTGSTQAMDGVARTMSYQYDADGNRTQVAFPDGNFVTYTYDGLDRPTSILRSGSATVASYTYNAAGQRDGFNGAVSTAYGYDGIGRVTSVANTLANATYNNGYGFSYNPASQITQLSKSNSLFAFADTYNVNRSYTVNGLNQYVTAGQASFGYDLNGSLASDGSTTFVYDIENRLVSASGAHSATLRYDPLGRLYETSGASGTTRFLYDGDALVGEYDTGGNLLRRYVHGADSAADDPIAWYEGTGFDGSNERILRPDWQGSIALIADTTGSNVFGVNTYDEYGIPGRNNLGRFQYTGQAWQPDLGMYYYKARFYSPTLGRFLQTDPIGYKDQINLYAYVANDPVNRTDPTGKYQRGEGFDDKEWKKFDAAQKKEAAKLDKMASKLEAKAAKQEEKTAGAGYYTRGAALRLRSNAAGLRDTSFLAAKANIYTPSQYAAFGRPEGSQAFTNGMTTNFLRGGLGIFGQGGVGTEWIIGHEGFHTIGLSDQRGLNGEIGYKGGEEVNTESLRSMRGTPKAVINPDSLLNGDN